MQWLNLGLPELLVILVIVVLLFGVGKLPQLGKGLGEGIKNFKKGLKDEESQPEAPKQIEVKPDESGKKA